MQTHCKAESVIIMVCGLTQHELLRMQDSFIIAVVDQYPEGLSSSVVLTVPSELFMYFQVKLDPKHRPC
jgi:hypothetical protein